MEVTKNVVIPPGSEQIVDVHPKRSERAIWQDLDVKYGIVTPIAIEHRVSMTSYGVTDGVHVVLMFNPTRKTIVIPKGKHVADFHSRSEEDVEVWNTTVACTCGGTHRAEVARDASTTETSSQHNPRPQRPVYSRVRVSGVASRV